MTSPPAASWLMVGLLGGGGLSLGLGTTAGGLVDGVCGALVCCGQGSTRVCCAWPLACLPSTEDDFVHGCLVDDSTFKSLMVLADFDGFGFGFIGGGGLPAAMEE